MVDRDVTTDINAKGSSHAMWAAMFKTAVVGGGYAPNTGLTVGIEVHENGVAHRVLKYVAYVTL